MAEPKPSDSGAPAPTRAKSPAARFAILQGLVAIASNLTSAQLEAFAARLIDALFKVADQSVRPAQANLGASMGDRLKQNAPAFCRAVANRINQLLQQEIKAAVSNGPAAAHEADDLSLVSFDEMENKVLIGNLAKAIEHENADLIELLNLRLAHLLGREAIGIAQNPFRPAIFLQAVHDAWSERDTVAESQALLLNLLHPDVFLPLAPVLAALNDTLAARGILPDLAKPYRRGDDRRRASPSAEKGRAVPLYQKLQSWLGAAKNEQPERRPGTGSSGAAAPRSPRTSAADVLEPELLRYLSEYQLRHRELQVKAPAFRTPLGTAVLRNVRTEAPPGALTAGDENTIELLAKIFDFVLAEKSLQPDIRNLIGALQIPVLKVALADKNFFFREDHPARRLLDTVAASSSAWNQEKGRDDPLYQMIERIVERVQADFDQQIELFSDAVTELDGFLAEEGQATDDELAEPIALAMRQEKVQTARESSDEDITARLDTGEVAGFVEVFLESQWSKVLTMAHCVADSRPEVLEQVRGAMDTLIWSLKPKSGVEERKELLTKLPAMLSRLNAWLNAIKWNDPQRVSFFANLADRHAAIMRAPLEMSARRQVEIAVNVAQKASERQLSTRARKMEQKPRDNYSHLVNGIERGEWVEFVRADGSQARFKLAWISPRRTRFIFTNRQGRDPIAFSDEELAKTFRDQKAVIVPRASVVDRALAAAIDEIDAD